ncbi:MAG: hypothetical protein JSU08_16200 [Acidobacteria bacterium]|nr:hypothetical protein [Acidobacteriota bacterium]
MTTGNVFENIESAHEYMGLLCETLDEAAETIAAELDAPVSSTHGRQQDALRLVDYKLKVLRQHFVASRLVLNDLRTLRRYLFSERETVQRPVLR